MHGVGAAGCTLEVQRDEGDAQSTTEREGTEVRMQLDLLLSNARHLGAVLSEEKSSVKLAEQTLSGPKTLELRGIVFRKQ
jgi:hypothetical protein